MQRIALLIVLLTLVSVTKSSIFNQTELTFTGQKLDHFNNLDITTWAQRYWVIDDFYKPETGPIFLYICGEWTCQGLPDTRAWTGQLAKMFDGLVLVVEHRFYGKSQPFGDKSLQLDNMYKYLNVNQALEDLAYFIDWVKTNGQHNFTMPPMKNPWFAIGGSYPGAMSAWFRYKYPHLTQGALASSAVIHSILNYTEFDGIIRRAALSTGQWCSNAIHKANFYAQKLLGDPKTADALKQRFNATHLNAGEFLYYYADFFVLFVQYGRRTELCNMIGNKTDDQVLDVINKYANDNNITVNDYGSYYLKDPTYSATNIPVSRQWTFQFCSTFGWLQTAPDVDNSMRGTWVNLTMYQQLCTDSYNSSVWPRNQNVNLEYGGLNMETFNIMFSNAYDDPWQTASLLKSKGQMISLYINCTDCGHCIDLHAPMENDPPQVKEARQKEVVYFTKWIQEHWERRGDDIVVAPKLQYMNEYYHIEKGLNLQEKGIH